MYVPKNEKKTNVKINNNNNNNRVKKKRDVRREENEKAIMYTNKYKTLLCIERERKEKKRKTIVRIWMCIYDRNTVFV